MHRLAKNNRLQGTELHNTQMNSVVGNRRQRRAANAALKRHERQTRKEDSMTTVSTPVVTPQKNKSNDLSVGSYKSRVFKALRRLTRSGRRDETQIAKYLKKQGIAGERGSHDSDILAMYLRSVGIVVRECNYGTVYGPDNHAVLYDDTYPTVVSFQKLFDNDALDTE